MAKSRFGFDKREPNPWDPKYPSFAIEKDHDPDTAILGQPSEDAGFGEKWTEAPEDSHLWGFVFLDYRKHRSIILSYDRKSKLYVRFKPPRNHPEKGISEYVYEFADHSLGQGYFEKMIGHSDPGEVVWEMIRAGIPYRPLKK